MATGLLSGYAAAFDGSPSLLAKRGYLQRDCSLRLREGRRIKTKLRLRCESVLWTHVQLTCPASESGCKIQLSISCLNARQDKESAVSSWKRRPLFGPTTFVVLSYESSSCFLQMTIRQLLMVFCTVTSCLCSDAGLLMSSAPCFVLPYVCGYVCGARSATRCRLYQPLFVVGGKGVRSLILLSKFSYSYSARRHVSTRPCNRILRNLARRTSFLMYKRRATPAAKSHQRGAAATGR
mmetsp:Transcript_8339/g.21513  ORF Transcript_8339/g.21513 Transcript_8339/m.21513 type:complete len:237 (+) Transcript_8339:582-1292(+)